MVNKKQRNSDIKKICYDDSSDESEDFGDDIFDLREEDLDNLDAKLKALDESDNDEQVPKKIRKVENKKKSVVDDQFFNLEEMNKFLDDQDDKEEVMVTDDEDDDVDFETDYKYCDFFEESKKEENSKKRVSFAPDVIDGNEDDMTDESENEDVEEAEDEESEDDENEMEEDGPVLIGDNEEEKASTTHSKTKRKLEEAIEKIQKENLNPRSWELSGEVTGDARSKDSLLEKFIEVDFRHRNPPINGQEKSDKIMSICLKRFKEKVSRFYLFMLQIAHLVL